jgi:hypothetical protein
VPTNFPTALDTFPDAATLASHTLNTDPHSTLHGNLGDALAALEAKVGVDGSSVPSALDYLLSLKAALASPTFTGSPSGPTPSLADSSTRLATTAYVQGQGYLTSVPPAPVSSVFGRVGLVVPVSGDYSVGQVTGAAPLASPTFTGTPSAPTAALGTNTAQLATTAFVLANAPALPPDVARTGVANTFTVGPQTIETGADSNVGLVVKGNSPTQSVNLQEWQDSNGVVKARVGPDGSSLFTNSDSARLEVLNGNVSTVVGSFDVRGSHFQGSLFGANAFLFSAFYSGSSVVPLYRCDGTHHFYDATGTQIVTFENTGMNLADAYRIGHPQYGVYYSRTDSLRFDWYFKTASWNGIPAHYYFDSLEASGTGLACGFSFDLRARSSTTNSQDLARIGFDWANGTDATRAGRITLASYYITTAQEGLRIEAAGAGPLIGFLGASAVGQQSLGAAATDAASTQALVNNIRAALIALGLCKT